MIELAVVRIISNRENEELRLEAFVEMARFVLEIEDAPCACEISIAIVDIDEMSDLNKQYRDIEGPTDVLSFPCDAPDTIVQEGEPITLGDIIISPEIAEQQARELGHSIEEELNLLVVHGVLHLLGYDHIDDADARVMEAREKSILEAWRIQ